MGNRLVVDRGWGEMGAGRYGAMDDRIDSLVFSMAVMVL